MSIKSMSGSGAIEEVICHNSWEHRGIVYAPGDLIRISGLRGNCKFVEHCRNERSNSEWVTVWHVGYRYRSVRPNRVLSGKRGQGKKPAPVCSLHPRYTASRRPRSGCSICWDAFLQKRSKKSG